VKPNPAHQAAEHGSHHRDHRRERWRGRLDRRHPQENLQGPRPSFTEEPFPPRLTNLPEQWLQCQANGSNVSRVLRPLRDRIHVPDSGYGFGYPNRFGYGYHLPPYGTAYRRALRSTRTRRCKYALYQPRVGSSCSPLGRQIHARPFEPSIKSHFWKVLSTFGDKCPRNGSNNEDGIPPLRAFYW